MKVFGCFSIVNIMMDVLSFFSHWQERERKEAAMHHTRCYLLGMSTLQLDHHSASSRRKKFLFSLVKEKKRDCEAFRFLFSFPPVLPWQREKEGNKFQESGVASWYHRAASSLLYTRSGCKQTKSFKSFFFPIRSNCFFYFLFATVFAYSTQQKKKEVASTFFSPPPPLFFAQGTGLYSHATPSRPGLE